MSFKLVLIFTSFSILQFTLIVQQKSLGQRARRDLSAYDQAGPYELNNDIHPRNSDLILGEIRGFLWEHWKQRRLGVVKATFFSIEGDQTSSSFFVEPDSKGSWSIKVESLSTISALLGKRSTARREVTHEVYNEIERIEATTGNSASLVLIPAEAIRQSHTYRLRLRNKHTNSLRIF